MSITSNTSGSCAIDVEYESITVGSITSCEYNRETLRLLKADDPRLTHLVVSYGQDTHEGDETYHFCGGGNLSSRGREKCLGWIGHFAGKSSRLKSFGFCCAQRQHGVEEIVEFGEEDIAKLFHGLCHNTMIEELFLSEVTLEVVLPQVVGFVKNRDLKTFHIFCCDWVGTESGHMQSIIQDCSNLQELAIGGPSDVDPDDYPLDEVAALVFDIAQTTVGLHRLELLSLEAMFLSSGACKAIGSLIRTSTTLSTVGLSDCYIGDVKQIADAVATNDSIKDLSFHNNGYGIGLHCRRFGDKGAECFANALACNRTLTKLDIGRNGITRAGWDLFKNSLCSTATIADTYYSNHVIQQLVPNEVDVVGQLIISEGTRELLRLNRADYAHLTGDDDVFAFNQGSTSHVAVNKILKFHKHFEMRPFFGFGLVLLPYVIEWFERAGTIKRDFDARIDQKKMWTLYQFVRELPELSVESFAGKLETASEKRMRIH